VVPVRTLWVPPLTSIDKLLTGPLYNFFTGIRWLFLVSGLLRGRRPGPLIACTPRNSDAQRRVPSSQRAAVFFG